MHRSLIKLRKFTILTHRWMGVAFCVLFFMWFTSGIVMMYTEYPVLSNETRTAHLPVLNLGAIKLSAADALRVARLSKPEQVILSSLNNRPVYRIRSKGGIQTVFADSGELFSHLSKAEAREIASTWTQLSSQNAELQDKLTVEDQWTVTSKYRPYRPLWKWAWPSGETVYVSDTTGETVQFTDRSRRIGSYFGAIPHWIYFTQLRRDAARWNAVVIWTSASGAVMTILGLVAGIWLYSPKRRYRYQGQPSHVPYAKDKRWHVILGLVFGLFTFTWVLSGMFSMSILQSKPDPEVSQAKKALYDLGWSAEEWKLSIPQSLSSKEVREIEFVHSLGQPAFLAYGLHGKTALFSAAGTEIHPQKSQLVEQLARAIAPNRITVTRDVIEYELYYVDRHHEKPLPALYLETDSSNISAFYVDLATGRIVQTYGAMARWNRWLYHGLHSWDLPWLYRHRPLWDILVIVAMIGGTLLSWTGIRIGVQRIRRKLAMMHG